MALNRSTRYPGRFNAATTTHPQGAFKNRTSPTSQDGSYLEADWANDWDGFFGSLLSAAGLTADGNVDAVGASQYYSALSALFRSASTIVPISGGGTGETIDGSLIPVGIPQPWSLSTPPTGWIICNGASFSATTYPKLAIAYPSLVLPDLRANVIRGWDNGRGIDTSRVLLSEQTDAIRNITGNVNPGFFDGAAASFTGAFTALGTTTQTVRGSNSTLTATAFQFDASRVVPTASENRMRNIAFNYIVRAA